MWPSHVSGALQWGRASMSAETGAALARFAMGADELQWGRASMSAETRRTSAHPPPRPGASMGPRFDERGNDPLGGALYSNKLAASMGPRFDERGNQTSSPAAFQRPWRVLQWGRASMSAETL